MKRTTSDEERKEFEQDFREARPIRPRGAAKAVKNRDEPSPAREAQDGGGGRSSARAAKTGGGEIPTGINGATQDRLRKGLLEPDARIDLHGMTQTAAHRALFVFLAGAHSRGYRLVLVVTGKGNPRKDESASWMQSPHGVLKQMVPRWLNQPEMASLIASTSAAHVRHGGAGALYIYLRKPG